MIENGVTVNLVREGSAAEQAGLQKGDVITSYNGTPVRNGNHLTNAIKAGKSKPEATIHFSRGAGEVQQISVPSGPLGIQSKDIESQIPTRPPGSTEKEPSTFWTRLIMFVATLILLLNILDAVISLMLTRVHLMTLISAAESVLFGLFYYAVAWVLVSIWENSMVIRTRLTK